MKRLAELEARRATLLAQAAHERSSLRDSLDSLGTPLRVADRAYRMVRWVQRHPVATAASAAGMAALGRRKPLSLARYAFIAWRAWSWATRLGSRPTAR
jgi:hypothetical protein